MNFSGLSLMLSGKDIDCSTHAEETVFCAYQGGNLRIGFKAEFLKQTLENITTKEVQFKLGTQERAGVITPVADDDRSQPFNHLGDAPPQVLSQDWLLQHRYLGNAPLLACASAGSTFINKG